MNLADAKLARSNGTLTVRFGEHSLAVDERALEQRPSLAAHEGKPVIVGIRPEDIEDAALESGAPADRRLRVEVDLREALGSDVVAHFGSGVPPVVTQDTKELMADVAHDAVDAVETVDESVFIARLDAETRVAEGGQAELAVDTRKLHFFDPETGLGIY